MNKDIESLKLKDILVDLKNMKRDNRNNYLITLERLKLSFILEKDILNLNKLAIVFSDLKVHSAVPLIISKLISDEFRDSSGTLIYSLKGLKINHFQPELHSLRGKEINYEMDKMLAKIGV